MPIEYQGSSQRPMLKDFTKDIKSLSYLTTQQNKQTTIVIEMETNQKGKEENLDHLTA
jgi:hypothetical protein